MMSFLNTTRPDRTPAPISGNPTNGLCERVCIQVKKVFDACMKQESLEGISLQIANLNPPNVTQPLTFVSARSTVTRGVVSNLSVTPIDDATNASRVTCNIAVPVEVVFVDAAGVTGTGEGTVYLTRDVVLHTPRPSVIPYEVEAVVNLVSPEGTYDGNNTFTVTMCATSIIKIIMEVELLVPSYGYCYIPPCQEYKEEVCEGFFDLPLYPPTAGRPR